MNAIWIEALAPYEKGRLECQREARRETPSAHPLGYLSQNCLTTSRTRSWLSQ
jgi:hypothetical protein